MIELVDTHCHIQEVGVGDLWRKAPSADADAMITRAAEQGVTKLLCVGTTVADSRLAVEFVASRANCWASVGLHPHEAKEGEGALRELEALPTNPTPHNREAASGSTPFLERVLPQGAAESEERGADEDRGLANGNLLTSNPAISASLGQKGLDHPAKQAGGLLRPTGQQSLSGQGTTGVAADVSNKGRDWQTKKIVAIGECGLDYYYTHSPKEDQIKALRFQIELAQAHNLPLIFHVRDAFDAFWPIFDSYQNLRGVLHSFTDSKANLDKALERGLHIGINGIMTFTKNADQLAMAKAIPLQNLLLETDAPFLTPHPHRGTVNEPAHVRTIAEFLADLRGESLAAIAAQTTYNAQRLFNL